MASENTSYFDTEQTWHVKAMRGAQDQTLISGVSADVAIAFMQRERSSFARQGWLLAVSVDR